MPVYCLWTVCLSNESTHESPVSCFRPCFCSRLLFLFVVFAQWACLVSLFKYCLWSPDCVSYWSLSFAELFWIVVVISLALALWFIFIFGWVSNNCMYVLMWSWCDGGSSSQNAIIPQCPTPNVGMIPQCHPSRKVLHFIWSWRHVEIPSMSSEYFVWRHVYDVTYFSCSIFDFWMISFSD